MAYPAMGRLGNRWCHRSVAVELGCCTRYFTYYLCGSHWCMVLCRVSTLSLISLRFLTRLVFQFKSTPATSNGYAYYSWCYPSLHLSISGVHRSECTYHGCHSYAYTLDHRVASLAFILPACSPALASTTHSRCWYGSKLLGERDNVVQQVCSCVHWPYR